MSVSLKIQERKGVDIAFAYEYKTHVSSKVLALQDTPVVSAFDAFKTEFANMPIYLYNIEKNLDKCGGCQSDLDSAIGSSYQIQNKITLIDSYIANLNSTATSDYIKYALSDCSVISTNLDNIKGSILLLTEDKMGLNPGSNAIIWVNETVTYIMGGKSQYNTIYYNGLKPLLGVYISKLQALLPAN